MGATIEFVFDFASPNAYLAYRALPPILERTGARLVINPCLLGGIFKATGNVAPGVAFAAVKGKRVAIVLSGGNIDMSVFARVLVGETPEV